MPPKPTTEELELAKLKLETLKARGGIRTLVAVVASCVAMLSTMAALLGMPKCSDLVTVAEAKESHEKIEDRVDKIEANLERTTELQRQNAATIKVLLDRSER